MAKVICSAQGGQVTLGKPTPHPLETRVGSIEGLGIDGWSTRAKKEKEKRMPNEPMAAIDETTKEVARAKLGRDIVSRPEYASEEDGVDAPMIADSAFYFATQ